MMLTLELEAVYAYDIFEDFLDIGYWLFSIFVVYVYRQMCLVHTVR